MTEQTFYIVTFFGCNSSYNDMWEPEVYLYKNKEDAEQHYNKIANEKLSKEEYDNNEDDESCHQRINKYEESKSFIQYGGEDYHKRPSGVLMKKITLK